MKVFDGNWQAFLARTVVFGVVVFGAVKLAVADPGGPASPDMMTYAGVLRTASDMPFVGTTTLTFVFHKGGSSAGAALLPSRGLTSLRRAA